jgi:hypothetical protein
MMNGLWSILNEDFDFGGFGHNQSANIYNDLKNAPCRCDGIFSEHKNCRSYDQNLLSSNNKGESDMINVCGMNDILPSITFRTVSAEGLSIKNDIFPDLDIFCVDPRNMSTSKLYFIFLQSVDNTEVKLFLPQLEIFLGYIKTSIKNCKHDISKSFRIVFSAMPIESASKDADFPNQSKSHVMTFYHAMTEILQTKYPSILYLPFLNLTEYGVLNDCSSDGYHQMTSTNVIKAMTLLNVLRDIAFDTKFIFN